MRPKNRRVFNVRRPDVPKLDDFGIEDQPLGEISEGILLLRVDTISVDAFIRTTLDEGGLHAMTPIGGTVTASRGTL